MPDAHLLRHLTATFNLPVRGSDIPAWRGAFIAMAGIENDLLHNHNNNPQSAVGSLQPAIGGEAGANGNGFSMKPDLGEPAKMPTANSQSPTAKFLYRYPLVQYRSIKGKAAIFAMNEGIPAVQQVLAKTNWEISWQEQPVTLQLEGLDMKDHYLQLTKEMRPYRLRRWLPFNDDNYQRWLDAPDLHARVNLLESVLAGQLLNFCKGAGWQLPQRFDLRLLHLHATHQMRYHDTPRVALDVTYKANLLLPHGAAIGKAVSHGFGLNYPDLDK